MIWSTQDMVSMGISHRAQRQFLDDTLWAMGRITNSQRVSPTSPTKGKAIGLNGVTQAERGPITSTQAFNRTEGA